MPLGISGLLLWFSASAAFAAAWTIDDLMDALGENRLVSVAYTERKDLAALSVPLETVGTMTFKAPNYLKKVVTKPHWESYEISGDQVTINSDDGQQRLSLSEHPPIRAFVESLRATLAGDAAALQRYYRVTLVGDSPSWTLRLDPLDDEMAQYVETIVIRGQQGRIVSIDTHETNGDRSVVTIESVP
jgi:outer membrane lipoprotein-sorting protein